MRLSAKTSFAALFGAALLGFGGAGCDEGPAAAPRYYQRVIQPILTANCVRGAGQGSCHVDDGTGNALGNLDLTSYEAITRRRDVLRVYGSYPVPLLLLKASGKAVPPIPYQPAGAAEARFFPSEIDHAGGATLSPESNAYFELLQWMANGATEDGRVAERPEQMGTGPCRSDFQQMRPDLAARVATVDANSDAFKTFVRDVEPTLTRSCASGTCHSAQQSDFFLTCQGSGDDASKFNFLSSQQWVGASPDTSLLVVKPLAPMAGGIAHTGGVFFETRSDPDWKKIYDWAASVGATAGAMPATEGERFFVNHVMPVFLRRGCSLEACHSPGAANDFKLRAGTRGFYSAYTLKTDYFVARHDFLVPEVPDVRQSRIVKKPIQSMDEGGVGLIHRGGPPLQTAGDALDPASCPQPWNETTSSPFCTMVEWHRLERADLIAKGEADPMTPGSALPFVAVVRPPDADRPIELDTFRGGADLVLGRMTLGPMGAVDPASGASQGSLLDNCPGVGAGRANVDVRGPDVSYDASKVVFAMRLGQADSLDLYEVTLDAARTCRKLTDGNGRTQNGILIHNLDPMYAPDGTIVFASTRGKPGVGPTRSPKYLLPQTDLWRMKPNGMGGFDAPEQMTALNGSELNPSMMLNGQVTFTAEKATADFYQLSGRRINWDLTDYHPLLAQRAMSPAKEGPPRPSIGYQQATDIHEGIDRNFLIILSDDGAKGGGGTIATFNRSIGPFEIDRFDVNFLRSVTLLDPAATGRAGPTQGAWRSPVSLPDGRILASYAPDVTNLATATEVRYDLVVLDPRTRARTPVAGFSGGGSSRVEAVVVMKREPRTLFKNLTQLVFGGRSDGMDRSMAEVHYPDVPMLGTLLGANLRSGRFVEALRAARKFVVYENPPTPADLAAAMAGRTGSQMVYYQPRKLGEVPLAADGSVHLRLPALTPLILELVDGAGNKLFTMSEEDQHGPGEFISRGVPERFFNSVCGGCHGSVSGRELDVAIDPDALTGASVSLSRDPSTAVQLTR
jgi:hypothetical protein